MSRHAPNTGRQDLAAVQRREAGVVSFFDNWLPERTLLDLGACGHHLALPLAERGFTVIAVDDSPPGRSAIAPLAETGKIHLISGDLRRRRLDEVFGAVFIADTALTRLTSLRSQLEYLAVAADHILDNGAVIVETLSRRNRTPRAPAPGATGVTLPELDLLARTASLHLEHRTSALLDDVIDGDQRGTVSVYGFTSTGDGPTRLRHPW